MSQTFSGSRGALLINGTKVAFIGGITINQENTLTPIDVLDQLQVAEHAETGHKVSFTATYFKVDANSAISLGLDFQNINDILSQPESTMEVFDSVENIVQYSMSGVKFEGGSGTLEARDVWRGTWNFRATQRTGGSL